MYNVSEAVSYELRGVYNDDIKRGVQGQSGLSCLSPVINIMRHPLWGRNQVRIFRTMHVLWIKLGGGGRGEGEGKHLQAICRSSQPMYVPAWLCQFLRQRLLTCL